MEESPRHSCLKLELPDPNEPDKVEPIFIKATWYDTHFDLSVTNGLDTWDCRASEEEVGGRAAQWDRPVAEYIELAERYLGFRQPGSVYKFIDAGDGHRRLSWTFEKEGTKLEWRWKCQPSSYPQHTNLEILDFLMDANIRLSEEVVAKTKSFDRLKLEAGKCLAQSERFSNEKTEFESASYAKFLSVLNSKKEKLRELRDQLAKVGGNGGKAVQEDEEGSTEKTESFDGESGSDLDTVKSGTGTSKDVQESKPRGRRRIAPK